MLWFYLVLAATILWGIGNVFTKFVLDKHIKNPVFYLLFITLFLTPFYIIFLLLFNPPILSYFFLLAIVSGFFFYVSAFLLYKAYTVEEVSRITPLAYTEVIFVLILSTIFLGETFTVEKYMGIFLIVIGAFLISYKRGLRLRRGAIFVLISSFLFGVYVVLSKYTLNYINFFDFYLGLLLGFSFTQVPIFVKYRITFFNVIRNLRKKIFVLLIIFGLLNTLTTLFLYLPALSLGPATLVSAVDATRPFFVLLFVSVLSLFFPQILKEEMSKKSIVLKIFASTLILLGVFLVG